MKTFKKTCETAHELFMLQVLVISTLESGPGTAKQPGKGERVRIMLWLGEPSWISIQPT